MKTFRDPVHGDIFLSDELVNLLDTRQFQRLRGIKQLGTASFVYPGAVHTRFEHSLGTYHMASKLLDVLEEFGTKIDSQVRRVILTGALVHDVGHIPFGHTIEDERRLFSRHDSPWRLNAMLCNGDMGNQLSALGIKEKVIGLFTGKPEVPWHEEIISGTFCADLLDYLARDAFFCGLPQRYDSRILRSLRTDGTHLYLDAEKDGIIREDIVSEVINLLRLRYFLTERVFFHHTKTSSGAMISKAVEQAVNLGLGLEEILPLTDERLCALLENRFAKDPVIKKIMNALACRHIYKRAYVLTRKVGEAFQNDLVSRFHNHIEKRLEAEEYLIKRLRLSPGDLIIYCPSSCMQLKEAEVLLKTSPKEALSLASLNVPEVNVLREKHQNLWRFYVFVLPEKADKIRKISRECEKFFGAENHLPALQSPQLYLGI